MTDGEKAEEYAENKRISDIDKGYDNRNVYYCGLEKGYLDGLAEGRKEKCLEQNNDRTIRPCEVMKENDELKAQIEKMKCCENCNNCRKGKCTEDKMFYARTLKECSEWELAE